MAGFLWTFAVQEVLKKVLKVAAQQIGVAWGFNKELSELTQWLTNSGAILRGINTKNESVRVWVDHLQDLVYEADDLLDELVYEDLRQKVESRKIKKVCNFFSSSNNPFLFRLKMTKRMNNIIEALHKHYIKASPLGLVALVGEESSEVHVNIDLKQIRETTSTLNFEEVIIGREVEVSKIVKLVIDSSNQYPMSIIPIVGMGGLGKTTLAKMVFNHELVKRHFDKTIWVCVSEPFIVMNILEGIFQSLTKTSSGLNKENLLQKLKHEMRGKNYFLVLDDVWNEEARLWGELSNCLKNIIGKSGNSILVTTRNENVATLMEIASSHRLEKLAHDHCWSLFKESANVRGLELEDIREEVVRKIGGVPLVAKVLGGAVKFDGDYERWMIKFESVVKNISKDDINFVSSTLKLSVDCLPLFSLKQCFAYCSNFPKDHIFDKESLIHMWIAEGFIQPQGEDNELLMEDIGEGYFNFLLSRSLLEVFHIDESEIITHFQMHDLIHDIAYAISNQQKVEPNLSSYGKNGVRKLRTLICFDEEIINDKIIEDYVRLRVLRVDEKGTKVFNSFSLFKHMRYLHVTCSSENFKNNLESISMLYNLETLKFGTRVPTLPKKLRNLVKLRHFKFYENVEGEIMPLHMSRLIHLQTLSAFGVGNEKGRKIEELGPLKNLKGSLSLSNLKEVKSKDEAIRAKLIEKKNLTKLDFNWYSGTKKNDFEVLEGLQPHHNLQLLTIKHYSGQAFPQSTFVEGLVQITFYRCYECEKLPVLGQLPYLEKLYISDMDSVRSIGSEFYRSTKSNQRVSFPKLKEFILCYMKNLENWEDVSNGIAFPLLVTLNINSCYKLMSVPDHFVSLQI